MQKGFICPECHAEHQDVDSLQLHYNKAHSQPTLDTPPAGPDEVHSLKDKIASYVSGLKSGVKSDGDDSLFDGSDLSREDNDSGRGHSKESADLRAEITRLSMENEALKRHLLDSESRCDTLKTCLEDLENGNLMLQSHLQSTKTQNYIQRDEFDSRNTESDDFTKSASTSTEDEVEGREDLASLAWFYDTLQNHMNKSELFISFLRDRSADQGYHSSTVSSDDFSQGCKSKKVAALAERIIVALEAAKKQPSENGASSQASSVAVADALRRENAALGEKLRAVQAELNEVNQERCNADVQLADLRKEVQMLNNVKKTASELRDAVASEKENCNGQLRILQDELSKSNSAVNEVRKLTEEQGVIINKVEQQLAACTIELDLRNAEISSLQSVLDETKRQAAEDRKRLEQDCRLLNSKQASANELADQLRATIEELNTEHRAQELLMQQRIDTMTDQLVDLRREASKLRAVVEKVEEERHGCEQQRLELSGQLELAKQEARAAVRRVESAEADYSNKAYEYEELSRKHDMVLAALQEMGMQHSNLQVDVNQWLTRKWEDDSAVTNCSCGRPFSVTVRKHHCRSCGSIFCNDCSNNVAKVASSKRPVRVCDSCREKLAAIQ